MSMNADIERYFNRLRGDSQDLACVSEYIQRLERSVCGLTVSDSEGQEIIDFVATASIDYARDEYVEEVDFSALIEG